MLSKVITLVGGVAGAASFSQFPEFSQQYIQRMGGAVDELSRFVAEFDADAAELGLSREAALVDLAAGGDMGRARAETVAGTITRQARLEADLRALEGAGPFTRAYEMRRFPTVRSRRGRGRLISLPCRSALKAECLRAQVFWVVLA